MEYTYLRMFQGHEEPKGEHVKTKSFENAKRENTHHSGERTSQNIQEALPMRGTVRIQVQKERGDNGKGLHGASNSGDKTSSANHDISDKANNTSIESKNSERAESNKDGEILDRVSFMLLKLLKQYKAQSMVDAPCRAHAHWMPELIAKVHHDLPNFRYICVDSNKEVLHMMRRRVKGKAHAKFISCQFWKDDQLPEADFFFSWGGLNKMKEGNVVKLLDNVATPGLFKYAVLGNHMKGSKVVESKAVALNLRAPPFLLQQPMRIVSNLTTEPVRKQMYLYRVSEMKKNPDTME